MAFPSDHSLLVLAGPLWDNERWSISLRTSDASFYTGEADAQAAADVLFDAIAAFWATSFGVGTNAQLDLMKYNLINTEGRYARPYTILRELTTLVTTSAGQTVFPPQVASVATLQTDASRGLASKGRIYLPAPVSTISTGGVITTTTRQAALTGAKSLLDMVNANLPAGQIVVASKVGAGMIRPVTSVAVGRVLDTMRSRRTSLEEDRASLDLAAPV